MRIEPSQISTLRQALSASPDKTAVLQAWAKTQGVSVPALARLDAGKSLGSAANLDDVFEGLSEADINHISRPRGLESLHKSGITGEGITVAVVDSGIAPHPDLKDKIVAFRDFTSGRATKKKPIDSTGHGTHVAGIIAGEGQEVGGIAPKASLVGCRVNNQDDAIRAIDWVIANKEKYSIDVLNLSLGVDAPKNPQDDLFRLAAERAVNSGLIVVAAGGNECATTLCPSTISSPGNSPEVITVGALDDRGTVEFEDDTVYASSSRGQVDGGKPDLIAEGVNILAPLAAGSSFASGLAKTAAYVALAGSSQATPMVTGTVALMLQINPGLSQQEVKTILKSTAQELSDVPRTAQGSGRLDVQGAVAAVQRGLK